MGETALMPPPAVKIKEFNGFHFTLYKQFESIFGRKKTKGGSCQEPPSEVR